MLLYRRCLTEGAVFLLLGAVAAGWVDLRWLDLLRHRKHFEHVRTVVLENQAYVAAVRDKYLQELAGQGANFIDFHGVGQFLSELPSNDRWDRFRHPRPIGRYAS